MANIPLAPLGSFLGGLFGSSPAQTPDQAPVIATPDTPASQPAQPAPPAQTVIYTVQSSATPPISTLSTVSTRTRKTKITSSSTPSASTSTATSTASPLSSTVLSKIASVQVSTPSLADSTPSATRVDISAGPPNQTSMNAGAIAGGIVGGLAVIALLTLGLVWLLRRPRRTMNEKARFHELSEGSVVSLVAYGHELPDTSRSNAGREKPLAAEPSESQPRPLPPAHLQAPLIYVTDESNTRQLICELPGSAPERFAEMESQQKYHPYRPRSR